MRKIIVSMFLLLTLFCSCSERSETALDLFNKAKALNYTDQKKAIEYLNNAIKLNPSYSDAYNERGIAYFQLGQNKLALDNFNEAIRLKPDNASAYGNRGFIYFNLGQYKSAIKDSNEAIRLKPDHASAYINRGVSYLKQSNQDLGCRDLQKACTLKKCGTLESAKKNGLCH